MKKLYFLLFLGLFGVVSYAQTESESCYEKYRKAFENLGAFEVEDGEHDKVIISIRNKAGIAECALGSVSVKNGEIVEVVVYYEDDTKDVLNFDFKDNIPWTVFNGISRTRITKADEQVNLMFTTKIKPKKKKFKQAPLPDFELND